MCAVNAGVVVVDVSFALKWVITETYTTEAVTSLEDWREQGVDTIAPALFASTTGTPLERVNVPHAFQTHLPAHGLPVMRFHDLRHAAATLMLSSGEELFTVSKIMEHTTVAMTADLYGHLSDEAGGAVVNRIDARRQRNAAS